MEPNKEYKHCLLEDAGAAHVALLHCPHCPRILKSNHTLHPSFPWALTLMCSNCSTRWIICTQCISIWKHMAKDTPAAQCHHKQKHNQSSKYAAIAKEEGFIEWETVYKVLAIILLHHKKSKMSMGIPRLVPHMALPWSCSHARPGQ